MPGRPSLVTRAAVASLTVWASTENRPFARRRCAIFPGAIARTLPRRLAVRSGSTTSVGSAKIDFCGTDIASVRPLRSRSAPRERAAPVCGVAADRHRRRSGWRAAPAGRRGATRPRRTPRRSAPRRPRAGGRCDAADAFIEMARGGEPNRAPRPADRHALRPADGLDAAAPSDPEREAGSTCGRTCGRLSACPGAASCAAARPPWRWTASEPLRRRLLARLAITLLSAAATLGRASTQLGRWCSTPCSGRDRHRLGPGLLC